MRMLSEFWKKHNIKDRMNIALKNALIKIRPELVAKLELYLNYKQAGEAADDILSILIDLVDRVC